jgi:hypothetical protein
LAPNAREMRRNLLGKSLKFHLRQFFFAKNNLSCRNTSVLSFCVRILCRALTVVSISRCLLVLACCLLHSVGTVEMLAHYIVISCKLSSYVLKKHACSLDKCVRCTSQFLPKRYKSRTCGGDVVSQASDVITPLPAMHLVQSMGVAA